MAAGMRDAVASPTNPIPPGGVAVRFTGRGRDYFRIWVADLLCMMLTLGLYWPWMRRRQWQFLNAGTWIGATPLGDARQMTAPGAWPRWREALILFPPLLLLWWHTRPGGILGWAWLLLVLSLSGPWWLRSGWRGRIGQLNWQGSQVRFDGSLGGACRAWLRMWLALLPLGLMLLVFVLEANGLGPEGLDRSLGSALSGLLRGLLFWCLALSVALALAGWYYNALRYGLRQIVHPVYPITSSLRFWPLLRAACIAVLLVLPVPFVAIGLIYANWPLLLSTLSIEPPGTLQTLVALSPAADTLLGGLRMDGASLDGAEVCVSCRALAVLGALLATGLIVLMGWRYFMARLWNQSWRTLSLPGGYIDSHLPAGRLMATGFFCDALTLLSGGLYHPFAVVRLARLKRESLRVMPVYAVDGGLPAERHAPARSQPLTPPPPAARAAALPRPRLHWLPALLLLVVPLCLLVLASLHGRALLGRYLIHTMPPTISQAIGEGALASLHRQGMQPSRLDPEVQRHWRQVLAEALEQAWPDSSLPAWRLDFAQGGSLLGANALALPGGQVILTDELVQLASEDGPARAERLLAGVLARELLHLHAHHAEQALLQSHLRRSAWLILSGRNPAELVALGVASVLQQGYSRADELAADRQAVRFMGARGDEPALLADFLARLHRQAAADPVRAVAARRIPVGMATQVLDAERQALYRSGAAPD